MMLPQSGQGGASSSGRKANVERDGSEPAAPTDPGPGEPSVVPRGPGIVAAWPAVTTRLVAVGPGTRLIGTGPTARAPGSVAGVVPSSFTCTPIACCWSLTRNLDASQRKM